MKFAVVASAVAFASSTSALVSNCAKFATAQEGDTCRSLAERSHASAQQLFKWNFIGDDAPVGDCAALVAGEEYCVKVDSALLKRNWFYKTKGLKGSKLALAKKKIASAKSAAAAAKKQPKKSAAKKTSTKKPVSKKPASKKTTTKKPVSKKTTTKKTTTTTKKSSGKVTQSKPGDDWSSTPATAPHNAVRHIISTCTKYATVSASDSWCGPFATEHGTTEANLYSWNAGLHKTCDNLDNGKAYCVGV